MAVARVPFRTLFAVAAVALLMSCAAFKGYPERLTDQAQDRAQVAALTEVEDITACLSQPSEQSRRRCRNEIVAARMYGIDVQFSHFEEDLFRQGRELGFGATVGSLGTSAAAAVTGTAVLSAVSAGIIGTRAAYEREVLAERTLIAIHTQMRAERARVAARLRQGLQLDADAYPLPLALADLDSYYHAGTVLGALIGITENVGVDLQEAQEELRLVSGIARTPPAAWLQAWLFDQTVSAEERGRRRDRVTAELSLRGVDVSRPVNVIIRDPAIEATSILEGVARAVGWPG